MAKDGTLKLYTEIDQKGAKQGISALEKSVKKFGVIVAAVFSVAKIVEFGKAGLRAASELESAMVGLNSTLNSQGRSYKNANKFINEYISDGLVPATNAITAYKNLALRGYDTSQIEKVMLAFKDSAAFGRQAGLTYGDAIQSATEGLKNENSILVDNAGVTKNVAKMWQDYAQQIGVTTNNLTQQQKIQAEVLGIMQETQHQVGDAARLAGTYQGALLSLSYAFNNLKVAVGNFIKPIAQVVIPVIKTAVLWLTRLFNLLAQVTGGLFGTAKAFGQQAEQQGAIAATGGAAAQSQEDLAKQTEKAGKAAKGALASFDELNVLQEDTGSTGAGSGGAGGGAGGGIDDIGGMSEAIGGLEISPKVQAALDKIKATFESVKDYLVSNFKPILDEIWSNMEPQIERFKETAMMVWEDLQTLGSPLKEWFLGDFTEYAQTALTVAGEIAVGVFDTFNTILRDMWTTVLFPGLQVAINLILPLITQLATQLVSTLGVAFQSVKEIVDTLWTEGVVPALAFIMEIWEDIWTSLMDFWQKWGEPIFEGIREAIENLKDILLTLWETTLKPIWDRIIDALSTIWKEHLKPLLDNVMDLVGEFISGALKVYNQVILPVVKWLIEILGPAFEKTFGVILNVVTSVVGNVIDIINGLVTFWKGVIQFLMGVFTADWAKAWDGIKNIFQGVWDSLVAIVKVPLNLIIGFINGMINAVVEGVNILIRMVNKLSFDVPDWVPNIGGETFGFNFSEFTAPQIPHLASGTVVPPGKPFMAMLGDNTSEHEIVSPLSTMQEATAQAFAPFAQLIVDAIEKQNLTVVLDGQVIYSNQQRVAHNRGTSLVTGSGIE